MYHFGSVRDHTLTLTPGLNRVPRQVATELFAAAEFLLCNREGEHLPARWLRKDTRISARIWVAEECYTVRAVRKDGLTELLAENDRGEDVTGWYRNLLHRCPEETAAESFNGRDPGISLRLSRYLEREEAALLSTRTQHLTDTPAFRKHLRGYIQSFKPEPIHSRKRYCIAISDRGRFLATDPEAPGKLFLSETEELLFRYLCFLHIAEFWAAFEQLRDLHHEKKPLLIRNFTEFLDASVDIEGFLQRTEKPERQILLPTDDREEGSKTERDR